MKMYEVWFRTGDDFEESNFCVILETDGKVEAPGAVEIAEVVDGDKDKIYNAFPDIIVKAT
jgi:hypothetical protein